VIVTTTMMVGAANIVAPRMVAIVLHNQYQQLYDQYQQLCWYFERLLSIPQQQLPVFPSGTLLMVALLKTPWFHADTSATIATSAAARVSGVQEERHSAAACFALRALEIGYRVSGKRRCFTAS
jgi:hypothetical protein